MSLQVHDLENLTTANEGLLVELDQLKRDEDEQERETFLTQGNLWRKRMI